MAQWLITNFIKELSTLIDLPEPVVEFGARQVEPGQDNDLRFALPGKRFIGTDLRPGPGVDRVEDLRSLSFTDGEVGTALCVDTLEHCEDPMRACRELHRVLSPGGVCVIASVGWFPIHGYPHDYWRFTPDGTRLLLASFDDVWVQGIGHPLLPSHVVAVARKGGELAFDGQRVTCLVKAQENWRQARGRIRLGPVQVSPAELLRAAARDLPRVVAQRVASRRGRAAGP